MEIFGSSVVKLYSADSLKRWSILNATQENVNLFFRVKSVLLTHNELMSFVLCIKSKTFFRSTSVILLCGGCRLD